MGIVFRQSVKTSIVVVSGAILGALILWLSTRFIPKQEYGFITILTRWAIMLAVFTPLGLNSTLAVFIHRYNNYYLKRKMLISVFLGVPFLITIVISSIYLALPEWVLGHFQPGDQPL